MIKLTAIQAAGEAELALRFSDSSHALWSAPALIARDMELPRPLSDPAYSAAPSSKAVRSLGPTA
jgi:hypothetical protein